MIGPGWRTVVLAAGVAALLPRGVAAQGVPAAVGGAVAGAVGGTVVTAAALTIAAMNESYLWDPMDAVGWPAVPVVTGLALGTWQGATDRGALGRATLWSAGLATLGAAGGAWLGGFISEDSRVPWQGGVIGAGVGVIAGWLIGSLGGGGDEGAPLTLGVSLPLGGPQ
jgi:hypothetical protein